MFVHLPYYDGQDGVPEGKAMLDLNIMVKAIEIINNKVRKFFLSLISYPQAYGKAPARTCRRTRVTFSLWGCECR